MSFVFAIIVILLLSGLRFDTVKSHNTGYMSRQHTNIVKGLFICLIFLSHFAGYIDNLSRLPLPDSLSLKAIQYLRQLVVVPFLFYSGYGVMTGIMTRTGYGDSILQRRSLTTLLNFDVAVLVFAVTSMLYGITYDWTTIALSFTGWEAVGNSNWYIFIIIGCYTLTWAAYKIGKSHRAVVAWLWLLTAVFAVVIAPFKDAYWYDTIAAYPFGALFALRRDDFERMFARHYRTCLAVCVAAYFVCYYLPRLGGFSHNLTSICFASLVVMLSYRIRLRCVPLEWCGEHLFPLYIYQRLPMMTAALIGGGAIAAEHTFAPATVCALITIAIAALYRFIAINTTRKDKHQNG